MARNQVNRRAVAKLLDAQSIVKRNFRATAQESCRFIDELIALINRGGPFRVIHDGDDYTVDPMRLRVHKTRVELDTAPALTLHLGNITDGDERGEYMTWQDGEDGLGERVVIALKDAAIPAANAYQAAA